MAKSTGNRGNAKSANASASDTCIGEIFGVSNRRRHSKIHSKSMGEIAVNWAGTRPV